ncbi:hypothetical protein ABIF66_008799 [Bradyrhizobium japonicum]
MSADEYDLEKSRTLRDAGMSLVLDHSLEFKEQFALYIANLPSGWTGQCEDIRKVWTGAQPHPNAWGACWSAAKKRGLLIELPSKHPMTATKSHGRRTNLHRRA